MVRTESPISEQAMQGTGSRVARRRGGRSRRGPGFLPAWTAAAALGFCALPSGAQETPASGIRAGGFLFLPSLEFGTRRDDNIYRTEQAVADTVFSVEPRLRIGSEWRNHALDVDIGGNWDEYNNASTEDKVDSFAIARGRLDVSQRTQLRFGVRRENLHEQRGDPNLPRSIAEPSGFARNGVDLGLSRQAGHFSLEVNGRMDVFAYENTRDETGERIVLDDRDRTRTEISAQAGYAFAPGTQIFVRATRDSRRYERPLQGYDRDSSGDGLEIGVAHDATRLIDIEVTLGRREQRYEDARLAPIDAPTVGVSLSWRPTLLTTVSVAMERTIEESSLRGASGYVRSSARFDISHELTRSVLLAAAYTFEEDDYQGIDRVYDKSIWWVVAGWRPNRWFRMRLGYQVDTRKANIVWDEYDRAYPFLRFRFQP